MRSGLLALAWRSSSFPPGLQEQSRPIRKTCSPAPINQIAIRRDEQVIDRSFEATVTFKTNVKCDQP
jgi:hypothetical protein